MAGGPLCTAAFGTGSNPQHWLYHFGLPDEPGPQKEQKATAAITQAAATQSSRHSHVRTAGHSGELGLAQLRLAQAAVQCML